jgi:putative CocE/NonD family hydrolase
MSRSSPNVEPMTSLRKFSGVVLLAISARQAMSQTFPLSRADIADSASLANTAHRLAKEVLAMYRDSSRTRYLDNHFRLEFLAGDYAAAAKDLAELRAARKDPAPVARALHVQYEILAAALRDSVDNDRPLADAFASQFRQRFARLDNATAAFATRAMLVSFRTLATDLRVSTPDFSMTPSVSMNDVLALLRAYQALESYREFGIVVRSLIAADEARRYVVDINVPVRTRDGATVCAIVARPRAARGKLPALVSFTIYADSIVSRTEALLSAAHGYVGIVGHTRGKACSPDKTVPYVHDGADAAALIDWVAAQSWSDGRVGMYGGSYSGFTPWAAAKYRPKALKAIMVGSPVAPGIDVPMEGNIFQSFVYPWPFYTMNNRWLDDITYNDNGRWNRLYRTWYTSGRSYRDMEKIDRTPNPGFAEWIAHPTVDRYWRSTIPQDSEYAKITIPVLQTSGYFFGGPGGALWYLREHYKNNPRAQHYFVIGPWDHPQAQRGVVSARGDTVTNIAGYETDPVSRIDIVARLRYQWFDYVLRGAPKPAILADRINYQVLGTNTWKHAPSIAAMSTGRLRFYMNAALSGERHGLTEAAGTPEGFVEQTVNLADRSDVGASLVGGILDTVIDTSNSVTFASEPLKSAMEVSGIISGRLDLIANKRDFDFSITLYELMPNGQYFQLPPYTSRASHVASLSERRLLEPERRERLDFEAHVRMVSRRVSAGSRLVMVLSIPKNALQQINYGTGKDVSDESLEDGAETLRIKWFGTGYVELPTRR